MSTARTTFESTVATAGKQQLSDLATAEANSQSTQATSGYAAGWIPGNPAGEATFLAAQKAATAAKIAARDTAERSKQSKLAVARAVLYDAGELG